MQKLYTLALAALVATSVSASERQQAVQTQIQSRSAVLELALTPAQRATLQAKGLQAKAARKAATVNEIAGDYVWSYYGLLKGDSGDLTSETAITVVDAATGKVSVDIMGLPVEATYDAAAGTISIPSKQWLFEDEDGDVYFYLKDANASTGKIEDGASSTPAAVGTIAGTTITFPELEVWALGDPDNESTGWYMLRLANVFTVPVDEGWKSVGTGKFEDAWLLPGIGIDQKTNIFDVEIEESSLRPGVYRIVNPYQGNSPVAPYNSSTSTGYIQFDTTDPAHVVFEAVNAGFANSSVGINSFYCINFVTSIMATYGVSLQEVVEASGDEVLWSTFKDNVVTIPSYYDTTIDDGAVVGWVNDACFGIQGDTTGGYVWTDDNNNPVDMCGAIWLPGAGVTDVAADASLAPVEYFNLQGVRVANPTEGLYIKRQGNQATKVVIR